jgi:hypothetical protein
MAKRYEGSKADMRQDRVGAKKAGMSAKQYERSAQDRKEDARGQAKLNAARKGKR